MIDSNIPKGVFYRYSPFFKINGLEFHNACEEKETWDMFCHPYVLKYDEKFGYKFEKGRLVAHGFCIQSTQIEWYTALLSDLKLNEEIMKALVDTGVNLKEDVVVVTSKEHDLLEDMLIEE